MSPPWTKYICLVLMKDSWEIREKLISWYHFPSIHQRTLENAATVMTITDVYHLYLFLPRRCLLLWLHICTERLTICYFLAWPSKAAWFILMGSGHIAASCLKVDSIRGAWAFTIPHLCTELSEDTDCLFKYSFDLVLKNISQGKKNQERSLNLLLKETQLLSFARRERYVHIWSQLLTSPFFSLLLEMVEFSILLLVFQVHTHLLPRN